MGYCGVISAAAKQASYGIGLPPRVVLVFSMYNWLWAEDLVLLSRN